MVEQWSPKPSIEVRVLVGPPEAEFKKVCLFPVIVYNRLNMIEDLSNPIEKGEPVGPEFGLIAMEAYNKAIESLADNVNGS